jgi:hypothetical protein
MDKNVPLGLALCLVALSFGPLVTRAYGAKQNPAEDAVQLIGESDDTATSIKSLSPYTDAPDADLVPFLQHLRRTMIEHSSGKFRERGRRALIALLLARQEGASAINIDLFRLLASTERPDRTKVNEMTRLVAAYHLAADGQVGAEAALNLLTTKATAKAVAKTTAKDRDPDSAVRLVAANALGMSGVIPTDQMITRLDAAIEVEPDREAQAEELQTLASFATTAPKAYQRLSQRLLRLPDCDLVQRTAMTLPAADLRLWIFKRLPGKEGSRGAQVRQWVKAVAFQSCKG